MSSTLEVSILRNVSIGTIFMRIIDDFLPEALRRCQIFAGNQSAFWNQLAVVLAERTQATKTCVLRWKSEGSPRLQVVSFAPESKQPSLPVSFDGDSFEVWFQECEKQGYAVRGEDPVRSGVALLVRLEVAEGERCSALLYFEDSAVGAGGELGQALCLAANTPELYIRHQQMVRLQEDVNHCVQTLDILGLLNEQDEYKAMAMALCNEAKRRFDCDRVSLGYLEDPYVRLQAISNMDRFEKKMDAISRLESAMEEAVDQDEDLLYPADEEKGYIFRDHEAYAKAEGVHHVLSVPLRMGQSAAGAMTFERSKRAFSENDLRAVRVLANQVTRRVVEMKKTSRWFGARWLGAIRDGLGSFLGYRKTWQKLGAIVGTVVVLLLVFLRLEYRVEAPFILRSTEIVHVPAPFKGYLSEVYTQVGDLVEPQQALLSLDASELLLERANIFAEIQRFTSEAEDAEAELRLSDMRVALAQKRQSEANLQLVEYRIGRANVIAPFAGIVVEGDLTDRIGAPVKQGDLLMRLTRMDNLYVELKVDERDIHDIQTSVDGEFAFNSKPDSHFGFDLSQIEPVAVAESTGNIFYVNGALQSSAESWWRPGMSGVAKINAGKRSLLWMCTHRLVDFLRIHLWW